jgi:hypothetical protein
MVGARAGSLGSIPIGRTRQVAEQVAKKGFFWEVAMRNIEYRSPIARTIRLRGIFGSKIVYRRPISEYVSSLLNPPSRAGMLCPNPNRATQVANRSSRISSKICLKAGSGP